VLYELGQPKTGPNVGPADLGLKSPIKSGAFFGLELDRSWRIGAGPELTPAQLRLAIVGGKEAVEAINRTNLRHWREHNAKACLIKRHDPPINILGGYKFPNASSVNLNRPTSPTNQAHNPHFAEVPDDLSMPEFLRLVPS
jgi:hypothetical protein